MAQDPKKPEEKPAEKPAEQIPPEEMTYPTPPLDPTTGAPIDTRFQTDQTKEATAQQPSPKSETKKEEEDKKENPRPRR